jgi:hypothetical protein
MYGYEEEPTEAVDAKDQVKPKAIDLNLDDIGDVWDEMGKAEVPKKEIDPLQPNVAYTSDEKLLASVRTPEGALEFVTKDDIQNLKTQINSALEQVVELFVGLEDKMDIWEKRVDEYNRKASHKL